ncbi:hypothetical protein PUR34_36850 [Streptomyces sp. JV185]|uniref:hypothetical protein n=1 Tax=Streptomyces sp. JV185 TaxID=858638 RepID=UPI002E792BF6|nr:hypothetical protein [Streptomyces sp. JV185]MEE1773590.1 hypothetical protein [Streptomyces sp. JV185]
MLGGPGTGELLPLRPYTTESRSARLRGPDTARPRGTGDVRAERPVTPVVVAWIEGRPYWPQDPYRTYRSIGPSAPEALGALAEMIPGST